MSLDIYFLHRPVRPVQYRTTSHEAAYRICCTVEIRGSTQVLCYFCAGMVHAQHSTVQHSAVQQYVWLRHGSTGNRSNSLKKKKKKKEAEEEEIL